MVNRAYRGPMKTTIALALLLAACGSPTMPADAGTELEDGGAEVHDAGQPDPWCDEGSNARCPEPFRAGCGDAVWVVVDFIGCAIVPADNGGVHYAVDCSTGEPVCGDGEPVCVPPDPALGCPR